MTKSNIHKKASFEDKFARKYACWVKNNPHAWHAEKVRTRRAFRRKMKNMLADWLHACFLLEWISMHARLTAWPVVGVCASCQRPAFYQVSDSAIFCYHFRHYFRDCIFPINHYNYKCKGEIKKMKKYLVVECEELSDQFECDADRTPICMTDDYSTYGLYYEVYELTPENTFRLVKDYTEPLEYGIAIYKWKDGNSENTTPDVIMRKFPERDRDSFALWEIEEFCMDYHFTEETPKAILKEISNCGTYGEEINGEWVVIGEYRDDRFSLGY